MKIWLMLALLVGAAVLSGCATTDPERESDIPWGAPEPWEGAPGIPGMESR